MAKDGYKSGQEFERQVARTMSVWSASANLKREVAGRRADDLPFSRRPTLSSSGLGQWEGDRDIMHVRGYRWPFVVQCKFDRDFSFDSLFSKAGEAKELRGWLDETSGQCKDYAGGYGRKLYGASVAGSHLHPLLVVGRPMYKTVVFFPSLCYPRVISGSMTGPFVTLCHVSVMWTGVPFDALAESTEVARVPC